MKDCTAVIFQKKSTSILLAILLSSIILQSCSNEKFIESPDKPSGNLDYEYKFKQPSAKPSQQKQSEILPLLVVLPQDLKKNTVKDAALMALHDINDDNLRILFSPDTEPFNNLNQTPRGLYEKWPTRSASNLVAVIGPLGASAGRFLIQRKPNTLINFALTNDSSLGSRHSIVVGLTPEHQAFFVASKITFQYNQPQLGFPEMLTKLGYGFFAKAKTIIQDNSQPKKLLPILVIGRSDKLFFTRYVNSLKLLFDNNFKKSINIRSVQEYINQPDLKTDSADIVVQDIGNNPELWSEIIQTALIYNQRKEVFEKRLELVKKQEILDILSKQEILEPAKYSAVIVIIHEKTEIRWISSLLEFFNNSWQKLKIIGMNSWQDYPSLLQESSLNKARFPSLSKNLTLENKLNTRYKSLFGIPPPYIAKQVYDTINLVYSNSRDGFLNLNESSSGALIPGWSSNYRLDNRGYLIPDLNMVEINKGKLNRLQPH